MELQSNRIYTVEETAEILSVRRETLLKLIYAKDLEASKLGRLWRIQGTNIYKFLDNTSNVNIDDVENNEDRLGRDEELSGQTTCFDFSSDEKNTENEEDVYFDFSN